MKTQENQDLKAYKEQEKKGNKKHSSKKTSNYQKTKSLVNSKETSQPQQEENKGETL